MARGKTLTMDQVVNKRGLAVATARHQAAVAKLNTKAADLRTQLAAIDAAIVQSNKDFEMAVNGQAAIALAPVVAPVVTETAPVADPVTAA
jgi:uncharacterized protein (DUF2141 family)